MTVGDDLAAVAALADHVRMMTARRDAAVRKAHKRGASLRAIAAATGLSHSGVDRIVKRG